MKEVLRKKVRLINTTLKSRMLLMIQFLFLNLKKDNEDK